VIARLCDRCSKPIVSDWDYAWCKECGETGTCHHGNRPHECNACFVESDNAYNAARSAVTRTPERKDELP
jgi:hypothetical protein